MKQGIQGFLDWLKIYEPFYYDVVKTRIEMMGPPTINTNLGFWDAIGSAISSVGSAVVQAAPAYVQYKQSKDLRKLEEAKLKLARKQIETQTPTTTTTVKVEKPLPDTTQSALNEILARLKIAEQNKPQPPTPTTYTPYVNAQQLTPTQYRQAVMGTVNKMDGNWFSDPKILLPAGLGVLALLILTRRR